MEKKSKAVFLDRDGTINEDTGYIDEIAKFKLLPKVPEAIKLLNEAGFKVIVVTNQSGVARGFFTEDKVREINRKMQQELCKKGAIIDAVYFCPHHPRIGNPRYRKICNCRKPKPGLLKQAAREHNIDLSSSYMVGDDLRDVQAGYNAGCKTVLLRGEKVNALSSKSIDTFNSRPHYVCENLYQAARWICSQDKKEQLNE